MSVDWQRVRYFYGIKWVYLTVMNINLFKFKPQYFVLVLWNAEERWIVWGDMTQCHVSISDSVKIILISTRRVEALNQTLNAQSCGSHMLKGRNTS